MIQYFGQQIKQYLIYKYQRDNANHNFTMKEINEGKTMLDIETYGTPDHPSALLLKALAIKKDAT